MHTRHIGHPLIATITLVTSAAALAQPPRGFGGPPPDFDPAARVAELAANYEQLAALDTDRSGTLNETEQAALRNALANGTLQPRGFRGGPPPGANRGPPGGPPDPTIIAVRIASMYERLANFDADKNGVLDATEQAALIENLPDFGGPGGRGPGGRFRPETILDHDARESWPARI